MLLSVLQVTCDSSATDSSELATQQVVAGSKGRIIFLNWDGILMAETTWGYK